MVLDTYYSGRPYHLDTENGHACSISRWGVVILKKTFLAAAIAASFFLGAAQAASADVCSSMLVGYGLATDQYNMYEDMINNAWDNYMEADITDDIYALDMKWEATVLSVQDDLDAEGCAYGPIL